VPAGEISFTAAIGRDKRLDPSEYPEIMGVTGRYAGRGLVAQAGFTEPRCGLLLRRSTLAELPLSWGHHDELQWTWFCTSIMVQHVRRSQAACQATNACHHEAASQC
jgi:hypothetical protein